MRTHLRLGTVGIFLSLVSSLSSGAEVQFPGANWESKAPRDLGLEADRLEAVAVALGGRGCIIKDGYLVHSWGSQSEKSDWLSSAKPVLSTLLMFAIQEKKVASPDTRIADFGWELQAKDRAISFRHLASMTSGYARPEPPGEAWAYNDFAIQLYQKTLFDRVFKEDPNVVANSAERLGALGLEDQLEFFSERRRIRASVRDFARIAWFWLNRGKWGARQLLPSEYFDDLMRPQTPRELPVSVAATTNDYLKIGTYGGGSEHFTRFGAGIYGGNWWFNGTGRLHLDQPTWPDAPADTIMSIGAGGNNAVLIPSLNLVVAGARGDWGKLEAGARDSVLNHRLKLIRWAGTPSSQSTAANLPASSPSNLEFQNGVAISGELKQFHGVTLTFRGPKCDEAGDPNPFRDYRLNVTFTLSAKGQRANLGIADRFVVPGHFAADGNASESGATGGDCWRVHFTPPTAGVWKWSVSFRSGPNVNLSTDSTAGTAVSPDGLSGEFQCGPSDKSGRDFRSQGLLQFVGQRYLQFSGSQKWFLKGGADSPENLLAYYEFDGTKPTHRYSPHALDFRAGDPTWRNGKGKNLIGALNYLADVGVNSAYMLTMNVRGDGKDVWPWTDDAERFRFDCSKLDQWEVVFTHMDKLGIMQHFVLQEQENDQLLDEGELGLSRRLYFRELISRFGHHPAITWNLGEENTNTTAQQKAFAKFFHEVDPYRHMVVVHTFPKQIEKVYAALLGDPDVDGASLQTNDTHQQTKQWIARSAAAGKTWVVCLDEIGPADTGVKPDQDDFNHDEVRRDHLWGHFLAGGAGVEWLFGYKYAHHDIGLEDFRSRDQMWRQTRLAVDYFENHLPFTNMTTADEYALPNGAFCFARPGEVYVAQWRREMPDLKIWLPETEFAITWFDPRLGSKLLSGTIGSVRGGGHVSVGRPPRDADRDWIVKLSRTGPEAKTVPPPRTSMN